MPDWPPWVMAENNPTNPNLTAGAGSAVKHMSTSAQFTFAAEFVAFLAAAAGLAMALLRGEVVVRPNWVRAPLGAGFASLAGAAFLRGSLIVHGATAEVIT